MALPGGPAGGSDYTQRGGVTFNYKANTNLDPAVVSALAQFDISGDGKVTAKDLMAGAQAIDSLKTQGKFLKRLVLILAGMVVLLLLGTFGLTALAIDLSKETTIKGQSMQTVSGEEVLVGSSDFAVEGGKLMDRGSRRLGEEGTAVQTGEATTKRTLSSTIPDDYMAQVKRMTVTSTAGTATMTFIVDSMERQVNGGAKCVSVVVLHTTEGTVTLDDTDVEFDANLSKQLENAGIEVGEITVSVGRRLTSASTLVGIFNFIAGSEWECQSVSKPEVGFAVLAALCTRT